ncbi:mitochondrial carrier [Lophiostoma macrostomum CBS 122681]|uniref:Mitochondrial carrier n=1 Tax=Lophiostoma macrostomum CBS 122681 TaxID=1314788 RepID=A0A6A6TCJ0_9PLEO|nr:mitochondrial carrier [Lophiostoma macrostomum CBS 122681]
MQNVLEPQRGRAWVESPYLRSLIAGGLAGTTVDLSLYPLDTLKTRLQSSTGFSSSGGFSGIYRGVGSALIGSAPGAALFFITYDSIKRHFASSSSSRPAPAPATRRNTEGKPYNDSSAGSVDVRNDALVHMLAASLGEVAACAVRVPTEVIKQRAQASQHPSSLSALTHILSQRHVHGYAHVWQELYRGWSITILREVPFTVIQFPLWEALKRYRCAASGRQEVSGLEGGVLGSLAGAVAAGITTPLDVLKTRLMLAKERVGMGEMLGRIVRESGPRAFFAGMGPRIGWISAGGAIFLGTYQWASNVLGGVEEL